MELENAEEILQILERYTKQKSKTIPDELNSYLTHVASTGDSVYSWSKVQYFFREKLAHVIKDFHDTTPRTEDLPVSRNVDAFNYDSLKTTLLERFDLFNAAPFTIQRLCELLNEPKKHYCRLDKFMRALEKNILVVSTVEPGHRQMGSENGDSINGDPLMDINVDVEMDKEPSSSSVPTIDKKTIEAQTESIIEETNTENKTDQGTSEKCAEPVNEDAKVSTNGHHNNELEEKIVEDSEANDEQTVVSSDPTDNASTVVETITVEVQPTELTEKANSPIADVSPPIFEASQVTTNIEQTKDSSADVEKRLDETDQSQNDTVVSTLKEDSKEIIVEKTPQNIPEGVKHLLDDDNNDEDCQPTAAKLIKIEELVSNVEAEVPTDVAKIDEVPANETNSDRQPANEEKEIVSETVLLDESAAMPTAQVDEQSVKQSNVDEKTVADEETVPTENTIIVEKQLDINVTAAIPTDIEHVQSDTIDETNNDTISNSDTSISPLASTISNDLDILEEDDDDELIEPIAADAEQNILEPLAEPDVEMLPSIDNPEQMAVEDPTSVLVSSNSDSSMDATQIIPPSSDEQMDVLENNLMDEDL